MNMEPRRTGAFLLSEANGQKSRDNVVVDASVALPVGIALGTPVVNPGEQAVAVPLTGVGDLNFAGFLWEAVPALGAGKTVKRAVIARDAELDWRELEHHSPAQPGDAELATSAVSNNGLTYRMKPADAL
jgi:hypothetical protein